MTCRVSERLKTEPVHHVLASTFDVCKLPLEQGSILIKQYVPHTTLEPFPIVGFFDRFNLLV